MKYFDDFGVMIDCSRNAVPSVAGLKRFFDAVAKMGYNVVMLYTEDTFEVENEPYFGYKRGRYSSAELRDLDAYARERGIELVPFIQTLAHLGTLKRWRAYRHKIFDIDDILLADEPRTYEFLENVFASIEKNFSSRRVHLGFDEAHNIGLGKYKDLHGFTDRYELLMRHLGKVCDIARAHGFETTLIANDLFFNLNPGVFATNEVRTFPREITESVPHGCETVYWDYFAVNEKRYDAMMKSSKNLCPEVWFSGGAWTWGTFAPNNKYSISRNSVAIPCAVKNGVRKAFLTLWGDNGGECAYEAVLPALMHAAALAEGLTEAETKAKFREITGEDFDDFLDLDLPNYIFGENVPVESPYFQHSMSNYAKTHLYDDIFLGTMSANLAPCDASIYKTYAARLHAHAKKSEKYSLLYENMGRLCDVMEKKLLLAKKIREAYTAGDKASLRALAEGDVSDCIRLTDAFYESFRAQWYAVNKTYGFEVQDARLGGLSRRLSSCRERLLDYSSGKIDEISELCEDILPMDDTYVTSWAEMISANHV